VKQTKALIDGTLVSLNIPETSQEYTEGARASGESMEESEGYLFRYDVPKKLGFENTLVPFELSVLFLQQVADKQAIVMETEILKKDSAEVATSHSHYKIAVELRKDFCDKFRIGTGSIITLTEQETFDE